MAEQEKNYLDLESTAAQVKKSIEEIVEKLTENVVENKDKIFTLEVNTENIPEDFDGAPTDDMLDKVKIRLKTVSAISPVEGKLGQMIMSDGNNWIEKSEFYTSLFTTGNSEEDGYTEVRFGPDLIDDPNIYGRPISRLVLSGNPLSLEDKESSSTIVAEKIEQADAKKFKMVVADTARSTFRNSANAIFENNINFIADNDGLHFSNNNDWDDIRFTISDGAKVDFNGNWHGSPKFFVHGNVNFNMDDGCYTDPIDGTQKRYWSLGNKYDDSIYGATVRIHDAALIEMSQSAYLKMGDYGRAYVGGSSFLKLDNSAQAYFQKDSKFYMNGGQFFMNEGAILFNPETYKPCICMNGGGHIVFNVDDSTAGGPTGSDYDPYLIANPTSLVFVGQGSAGCGLTLTGDYKPGDPIMKFGGPESLVPAHRNPHIQIADETMIIVDAARGGGSNYLKIGACGGGQTQTHIFDNTHLELRQNSIISLRGKCQNSTDGPIGDFPITRHYGPPDGTGSMLTMYDDAVFIMRSEWPAYKTSDYSNKTDHRNRNLSETTWKTDLDFWKKNGSPLFGMVGNSVLKLQGAAVIDMNNNSNITMDNGSSIRLNNGNISMTNQEITFSFGGKSATLTIDQLNSLTSNSIYTREIEESYELNTNYLPTTNREYRWTVGTIKSILFNNLTEENGLSDDYWALFIFRKDASTASINDIILNEDIKILNPDLDISAYTILHLLFTYDGFNICCKVAGY